MFRTPIWILALVFAATAHGEARNRVVEFDPFAVRVARRAAASTPANQTSSNIAAAISSYIPNAGIAAAQRDQNSASAIKDFYKASLGRDAGASEVAAWQNRANSGIPLDQIRVEIAQSDEAKNRIAGLFRETLGREPSDAELNNFRNELTRTGASLAQLRSYLANTAEGKAAAARSAAPTTPNNPPTPSNTLFGGQWDGKGIGTASAQNLSCFDLLTTCTRRVCQSSATQCDQCLAAYQSCQEYVNSNR